jgi:rod shape-determining protein MreC
MENFFTRYKNPLALMAVLFIQVVALATQVKRPENAKAGTGGSGTRLIRVWTVTAFTPVEKMFVSTGHFFRNGWHNYADLRGARRQNRELQEEVARLQMEQVRLKEDAAQARRLQTLLDFKENFIAKTVAAQVIAFSGTEQSRLITIDKGSRDGLKPDMAVITPDGVVGKVKDVFRLSSQVLLINDHDSGAGVILEHSRLQGIVKGTPLGELQINDIMSDEQVEAGEHVITSGGDRIYPKGYSVGTVTASTPDHDNDPFLVIKIKPAADLNRLEEVLVITEMADSSHSASAGPEPMRAADILSQRLPSVPKVDPNAPKTPGSAQAGVTQTGVPAPKASPTPNKPATAGTGQKPGNDVHWKLPPTGPGTTVPGTTAPGTTAPGTAAQGSTTNKAGADANTQSGPAQKTATPSGAVRTPVTPTPPKPKATPAKPRIPAAAPDSSEPGSPAATPVSTPEPTPAATQEKPPR